MQRLGLVDQLGASSPGSASILRAGRLHPVPPGSVLGIPTRVRSVLESRLLRPGDKGRLALDLVLPPRRSPADESVGSLVRRRLGSGTTERLVGPLLGGIYAGDVERLSAGAAFPQLVDFEHDAGSLIRGARRARRRGGGAAQFLAPRDGMEVLVDRLTERLDRATVCRSLAVRSVDRMRGSYVVTAGDRALPAQLVVLAVAPPVAARLLEPIAPDAASDLARIRTVSTAVVHLAYDRASSPTLQVGHGFVVPAREGLSITAATNVSAKWPHRGRRDLLLLRAYFGRDGSDPLELSDVDLIGRAAAEIARVLGLPADPVLGLVRRWPDSMPQPEVGHLERVARARAILARDAPGLLLVGGAYDGVGIPAIAAGVARQLSARASSSAP